MDATVFNCPGCGRPVDIDFKTRKGKCEWCGNDVTFPRTAFNNSEQAKSEIKLCMRCFEEGRFAEAKAHAENVLAVAIDHTPALYVRAYYEAFYAPNKNTERIAEFFEQLSDITEDRDEADLLKKLFQSTVFKLDCHEESVLKWAVSSMSGNELCAFVDSFSAILIGRRPSINFFTPTVEELYKEIAAKCSIPKVCYALLQAITTNPDSPYPLNEFFLAAKTNRFYNDFVLPVGEIIQSMNVQELRSKFYRVYQSSQENYKNKMLGGNT